MSPDLSVRAGANHRLHVDPEELAACVACGLCLPHCPTYRVSGLESASPRGRIAAMRAVEAGAPIEGEFVEYMELCVQCRGCEAACPSGVRFGNLIEGAMQALAEDTGTIRWWKKPAFRVLADHRALLAASSAIAAAQRLRLVPSRLGLPRLPVRRRALVSTGEDVWLFTGCVMDAWMRPVHEAVMRVLAATGAGVALPGNDAGCCGALHAHAGLVSDARDLARRTMSAFPGTAPILVDSAGCGAAMKDYGRLIGTDESARFSARVLDVHEWLSLNLDRLPMPRGEARFAELVAIQDPCHLRHVQKAHNSVRVVLSRYADLVELDDEGLCCGAGGAYSVQHAEMAGAIRERKLAAIARSGASVVVAANPGCAMHLAAAGVDVRHPLEIVDEVLKRGAHGG